MLGSKQISPVGNIIHSSLRTLFSKMLGFMGLTAQSMSTVTKETLLWKLNLAVPCS